MNRICALLGCSFPIIEGGLAYVGNGSLAAAVSEAGGFGQIGSGGRTPDAFAQEIEIALAQTDCPMGANIPISEHRDPTAYFTVVERYAKQLRAVSLSAGNPRPYMERMHELGLVVMTLASTPMQAVKAEQAGADIVICEGTEAGGHNGPAELTTFALLPNVSDAVSIPVVAAGGIADGRTAAAAFCLGAEAVQMGTRFVATVECEAHPHYKEALVRGDATDTTVMERSFGRVTRVMKSPFVSDILRQESKTPGDVEHLMPMISGKRNATAALQGELDNGWLNCGQSIGLIHEIASAGDVVRRVAQDAEAILRDVLRRN